MTYPVFQQKDFENLNGNKKLSITEIAKVTGKGRNTIYKVVKNELKYIPYN